MVVVAACLHFSYGGEETDVGRRRREAPSPPAAGKKVEKMNLLLPRPVCFHFSPLSLTEGVFNNFQTGQNLHRAII